MAFADTNWTEWRIVCSLAVAPMVVLSGSAAAKSPADDEQAEYIFKRGDTLTALAAKYFRKYSDYKIVQRQNRIANPRRISIGKRVTIPFKLLKYRSTEARLSAYRGNISIATAGRSLTPAKGLGIVEGSNIATAAGSFLTLSLEDGSRVSMPSNSKLRITRLRHILLTDSVDYEFAIDNGRVRSKVTPFDRKADRFRVRTPVAVSAVRGTDYRTRVDAETGTAYSETVEGTVDVAAGQNLQSGKRVTVPAGTGAAASVSGELAKADLLTPPELIEPAAVQTDVALQFNVTPRASASAHRALISTDAGFVDIVAERKADGTTITMPGIPDGRYFIKASSLAQNGFEGLPATYSFKRVLSTLSGSAGKGDFGFRFRWEGAGSGKRLYRFQLLEGSKTALPMVDEEGLTQDILTLSDLPDGEYFWRVGVTQFSGDSEDPEPVHTWTDFEKLTVTS